MERSSGPASDSEEDHASVQQSVAEEAPSPVTPDVAYEDTASGDVTTEDGRSVTEACDVGDPENVAPRDAKLKSVRPEKASRKCVVRKCTMFKRVACKHKCRKNVRIVRKCVTHENQTRKGVPSNNEYRKVAPGGDAISVLENAPSPQQDLDTIISGKAQDTISQLSENLAEAERRERCALSGCTLLMNDYVTLNQTLTTEKEVSAEYVRKIEDQAEEIKSLQAAIGELKCSKIMREERFGTLMHEQRMIMRCGLCLCVFARPVTLSCNHTFCHGCLGAGGMVGGVWTRVQCPYCRGRPKHTVQSLVLEELAETVRDPAGADSLS